MLVPSKRQWKSWSLPSRLTAVGTALGAISVLLWLVDKSVPPPQSTPIPSALLTLRYDGFYFARLERGLYEVEHRIAVHGPTYFYIQFTPNGLATLMEDPAGAYAPWSDEGAMLLLQAPSHPQPTWGPVSATWREDPTATLLGNSPTIKITFNVPHVWSFYASVLGDRLELFRVYNPPGSSADISVALPGGTALFHPAAVRSRP